MNNPLRHRNSIVLAATLVLSVFVAQLARAQTFKVLHTFHYNDGWWPQGQLLLDAAGDIYGITNLGGHPPCSYYQQGCGTVFKLNKNGKQVWLRSFDGPDGFSPSGGLLRNTTGEMFGVTTQGGRRVGRGGACQDGCGLIYDLDQAGKKETVLHKFTGIPQTGGYGPEGLLIEDSSGTFYGTTGWGGVNYGVVFKMSQSGKETVLYTFQGGADGYGPGSGVIEDSRGNLFGTTVYGGNTGCGSAGCGVVYEVDPAGKETVLYAFTGGADGGIASSSLIQDQSGNLYGTTAYGGSIETYICGDYEGCGVVYAVSPNGSETVLYAFCSQPPCSDGNRPLGGLIRDATGNLYGVTIFGGNTSCGAQEGCGVVFKLDPAGKETVLHVFSGGKDGAYPEGQLVMDTAGNLYGTASSGGDVSCEARYGGCGVVFKITP